MSMNRRKFLRGAAGLSVLAATVPAALAHEPSVAASGLFRLEAHTSDGSFATIRFTSSDGTMSMNFATGEVSILASRTETASDMA